MTNFFDYVYGPGLPEQVKDLYSHLSDIYRNCGEIYNGIWYDIFQFQKLVHQMENLFRRHGELVKELEVNKKKNKSNEVAARFEVKPSNIISAFDHRNSHC
uniref:Uncharacterized protein n=1 Tax=Nelumbo nucifera TaxID=4432 RepID=A0A822ZKW8_NELNU|nr:TPA_asm: hypothetical protein HUJ06_003623 [Nelumbo nucifera]